MYGHVEKLAEEIKKGAASVEGVEAKLWQVNLLFRFNLHLMMHCQCILNHNPITNTYRWENGRVRPVG